MIAGASVQRSIDTGTKNFLQELPGECRCSLYPRVCTHALLAEVREQLCEGHGRGGRAVRSKVLRCVCAALLYHALRSAVRFGVGTAKRQVGRASNLVGDLP